MSETPRPAVRVIYNETSKTEFRKGKGDGKEVEIPGRHLGRFGFVTTGQSLTLTAEEYDAVAGDPRFLTPEQWAAKTSKEEKGKGKGEDKTPAA